MHQKITLEINNWYLEINNLFVDFNNIFHVLTRFTLIFVLSTRELLILILFYNVRGLYHKHFSLHLEIRHYGFSSAYYLIVVKAKSVQVSTPLSLCRLRLCGGRR